MIRILDCTLRDGGYVNDWFFSEKDIKKIISSIIYSKIDILELGYLTQNSKQNTVLFSSVEDFNIFIDKFEIKIDIPILLMIDYGKFDINKLSYSKNISGIRLAFYKENYKDIFEHIKIINDLGYKLYLQPMVTNFYSDYELKDLLEKTSSYKIDSFYIVDSFGSFFPNDIENYFNKIDNFLDKKINIGLHSHDNISSSFLCAEKIISISKDRNIIIDSTINGIGRGAGNLSTEFISYFLNHSKNHKYNIEPFINESFFEKNYSQKLKYFISGLNKKHPFDS